MRMYGMDYVASICSFWFIFHFHDFIGTCAFEELIGNDVCNDEANTPKCNYDGADCCGDCVNTQSCSECQCHNEDIWQDLDYHGFNFNGTRIPFNIKVCSTVTHYAHVIWITISKSDKIHFLNLIYLHKDCHLLLLRSIKNLHLVHADPVDPEEDRVDCPGGDDRVEHPLEETPGPLRHQDLPRYRQDRGRPGRGLLDHLIGQMLERRNVIGQ